MKLVLHLFSSILRKSLSPVIIITGALLFIFENSFGQTTITKTIPSSTDDAEEAGTGAQSPYYPGAMYLNSSDLEIVTDLEPNANGIQKIGLRFTSINIPQGATITNAYLVFRAITPDAPNTNNDPTSLFIRGQNSDNTLTFNSTDFNISNRPLTTAQVGWTPSSWSSGADYNSPNISSVVQEIVNRPGWTTGNSMVIIINGTGSRSALSYESGTSTAPKLVITYTTGTPPPNVTGERCFSSPTIPNIVWAKSNWTVDNTNQTVTVRMTFSKTFVDNTYGTSAIGWPSGHSFSNLTGSDALLWSLKDANGVEKLKFEQDYISSSASFPSGYGTLGFGGDGGNPTVGSASDVLAFKTSLDYNFNDLGYVLTTNSPVTSSQYAPNPTYPDWIYEVWYEVTLKLSAFGAAGFGYPDVASIHASPSKTGNNTEVVNPSSCSGSVGDFVWHDTDGDGIQDAGEPGISGVTVTLTKPDNTTATATTNANGFYQFTNLSAGTYSIAFPTTITGGYALTISNAGANDGVDSDPLSTGIVSGIEIAPGQSNLTVDAGYVLSNLALGNKVFYDLNRSGMFDAGDGFVEGATVRLYNDANNDNVPDGAFIQAQQTNALGEYSFTNLAPGNYIVGVVIPSGYAITIINGGDADNNIDDDNNATTVVSGEARGTSITLVSGSEPTGGNTNNTYDIGLYNPITPPNDGESCFSGTNPIVYAKSYWSVNVSTQTVTLRVTFSKKFVDNCYKASGNADNWNDSHTFGNLTGSDHLQWSIRDANGVEKLAFRQDYISSSASFPSGYGCLGFGGDGSNPTVGLASDVLSFRTSLATNFNDFGYVLTSNSPSTDANYTPNPAQPNWIFDVWYEVTVKSSVFGSAGFGYVNVSSVHASPSKTGNNTEIITNNPCAAGSIGDRVWNDQDKDGIQDANEVGLAGVVVTLYDNATNNVIASTITDAYGNYKFSNLPTTAAGVGYQVRFSLLPGYQFSPLNADAAGVLGVNNSDANISTGRTGTVTLTNAVPNVTYVDAGMHYTVPARIGDFVWNDLDKDGIQEAGEPGIAGVTVMLYTSANVLYRSTVTSNNGYYSFNDLAPGTYYVKVAPPIGYQVSPKDATADNLDSDVDPVTRQTPNIVVVAGTNNLTIDAGLNVTPTTGTSASLGDKVWEDLNNNSIQDPGEPGIPNVTVQLYNSSNVLVATVTTDAFGNYIFNGLMPGSYYVKFILPSGYSFVTANTGSDDTKDSDADAATGNSQTVTLINNEINTTVDAGMRRTTAGAALGDFVWYDLDKDGVQDGGSEVGVPGITVLLYNTANVVVATTTTDINGFYLFTGLPAATTYTVGFENIPAGYGFSSNNGAVSVANNSDVNPFTGRTGNVTTGAAGSTINYVDAGLVITPNTFDSKGSIGDRVWNDLNNNGVQDPGEPGIPGVTVTLYAANGTTVIATTTSDALGNYLFTNLDAGSYVVGFSNLPAGYVFATKDAGTDDAKDSDADAGTGKTAPFTLAPGEINLSIDAGARNTNTALSAIGNFVWYDLNNNGIQDAGEPGAPGISVELADMAGNVVKTTTTSATGEYLFTDLPANNYFLKFGNLPAGYSIGIKNATGSTAANNSDVNTGTSKTDIIVLPAATTDLTWDMGIVSTTRASLGDFVWNDVDMNGRQDTGEPGVAGVLVTLYNSSNVAVASTVTDANGYYLFSNVLPGTYSVGFSNIPASSSFTIQNAGVATAATNSDPDPATGKTATFTLVGGQSKTDIDAGLVSLKASVGDYVWQDSNGNGIQDAGEPPVAGVTVILYNSANQPIASAVTDGNGYYLINNIPVPAGGDNYTIGFSDIPTDNFFTVKNAAGSTTNNNSDANTGTGITDPFTLNPGQIRSDIDAGLIKLLGSISDRIWNDTDRDGIQDAGELGLAGITVSLYDNSNNLIASTVTDAFGLYKFSGLPVSAAGINYQVQFSLASGYVFSPQNADAAGVTGANNSDANTTTGRTGNVTLTTATPNVTYVDAGMYISQPSRIGDFIWNDLDKDGLQDAGEPGIAGVVVTLYDNGGNPVSTTITDNNGHYEFNDVPAGTYTLGITPPPGYQASPKDATGDAADSDFNPTTFRTDPFVVAAGVDITRDGGLNVTDPAKASVGDFVWADLDNDNLQDANEPGIPGVTVELYTSANVLVASTTTNALGYYVFNNVDPGNYYVKFSNTPAGYALVTADSGGDDFKDSDVTGANGSGTTATFSLAADQNNMTIDAGLRSTTALNSLGDFVWYDLDKDGIQDAGEAGVPGITVTLYNATTGAVVKTTTTNASGLYMFTDVAADSYTVGFSNLPTGYAFSPADATGDAADSDPNPNTAHTGTITIAGTGNVITTVDAGIVSNPNVFDSKSSIGDFVWNDLNNNGIQDAGEPGIPGVTVTLYAADGTTVIATTTTDALGKYQFSNLPAGTYIVGFSGFPAGYSLSTLPNAGADDTKDSDADPGTGKTGPITLLAGQVNTTVDAALRNPAVLASVGNFVWNDVNGNGHQDAGEPGVPGVSVYLLDNLGNVLKNTVSDANGFYLFTDLAAGTYSIRFGNLPTGFVATAKDAAPANDNTDSDANTASLTTDPFTLAAGGIDLTRDFGVRSTTTASVGDYVWSDVDGDGQQDANEPGIAGVLITLYNSANVAVASAVTDANGKYLFVNVPPGSYTMGFSSLPLGSSFTTKDNGADASDSDVNPGTGLTDAFTLVAGQSNTTIDAGLVTSYAAVGDYVWQDLNGNGIQDAGEPPVAGVTVILYNSANQPVGSAVTDGNGFYLINNIPVVSGGASYTISFSDAPAGMLFTTKNAAGSTIDNDSNPNTATGITDVFTLNPGQIRPDIDAGLYKLASIGNYAWFDWNRNGIQDKLEDGVTNELPATNVLISLYKGDGTFVDSVRTDANGFYNFNALIPGDYYLQSQGVTYWPNFGLTALNAGTNTELDNDFATVTYRTVTTSLVSGETDNSWDIGVYRATFGIIDPCICKNNATNSQNGQFDEIIDINATPGGNWRIIAQTGMYLLSSPAPPAAPIPVPIGTVVPYVGSAIYSYKFIHIDSIGYSVTMTDGQDTLSITNVCEYPDINFQVFNATLCLYSPAIQLQSIPNMPGTVQYFLTANNVTTQITEVNPQQLGVGNFRLEAVFTPTDPQLCQDKYILDFTIQITSDCLDSLGNFVWYDANLNGLQDNGEAGIAGVTMQLYKDDNADNLPDGMAIATTTTNASGNYGFGSLPPGNYIVGAVLQTGYAPTTTTGTSSNPNNDDNSDNNGVNVVTGEVRSNFITLTVGGEPDVPADGDNTNGNLTLDFGLKGTGSIGNYVWQDLNNNGLQDTGEPGIAGVIVTLTLPNATTVSTVTGSNGEYLFANLLPGTYNVSFATPAGYIPATSNAGSNDAIDSDPVGGVVSGINLAAGENNLTVDAGFRKLINLSGNVWHDVNGLTDNLVNNSGAAQVPPASPIPVGLRAYLVNASTGLIEKVSVVVSSTGTFQFLNITPNTNYFVYLSTQAATVGSAPPPVTLPSGWKHTGQKNANPPNSTTGSDGIPGDGRVAVPGSSTDIIFINFGIKLSTGEVVIG
jgi:protocatechuate 3,4-dioxygenase beta subunit